MLFVIGLLLIPHLAHTDILTIDAFFPDGSNWEDKRIFDLAVDEVKKDFENLFNVEFLPRKHSVIQFDSFNMTRTVCRLMEEGMGVLLAPQSFETVEIFQSMSNQFHIPVVSTYPEYGQSEWFVASINLHPDYQLLAKGLLAIIKDMDWKSFAIVYEDPDSLIRLQEVLKASRLGKTAEDNVIFTAWKLEGDDYRPIFKQMLSETRIILDCSADKILKALADAKEVDMLGDYHRYVLTSLDAHTVDFGDFNIGRTNITTIRLIDTWEFDVQKTVFDFNDEVNKLGVRNGHMSPEAIKVETALVHDAVKYIGTSFKAYHKKHPGQMRHQKLSCKNRMKLKFGQTFGRVMKSVQSTGLTGKAKFDEFGRRIYFTLHITELTKNGYRKIGSWDPENGILYNRTRSEMARDIYQHISNKTFIVVSRLGPPYLFPKESLEGNDRFQGYSKDLIDEIAKELNFKYKFVLAPDGEYGSYNKDTKQWNGLIRELQERRADLAICDLTITYDRRSVVDFTMPFMRLGISILFSKPAKQPPTLFSFSEPLSFDVWICMATAYLAVSLLLYFLARITPHEWRNPHPCKLCPTELENNLTMQNVIWHNCGSLMQQGSDISTRALSTRLVASMWWFFVLIMISSYTANLTAFLTYVRMEGTIKSVSDLASSSKIKYGVMEGGASMNFFKNSNDSLYKRMWNQMESSKPTVFVKNNEEGVDRVLRSKRKYAFFMESTTIEYQMEKHCELTQVGGLLDSKDYGIAMPFNSPYRIAISGAVLKLQESGKLAKIKEKWWKVGKCRDDIGHKSDELGMDNVGGIFLVLLVGCACAFVQVIIEFLWNIRKVAVREKLSLHEAFYFEIKFALNCGAVSKPVRFTEEEDRFSVGDERNMSRSVSTRTAVNE
ncbi:glutamate receptor ionotropic, kainate 2-like [Cimex lectularius]|uniref:Uncharacterized protein n=1 Tax=Cimex lectularius TaxID=79782 RepID=A0A8I6SSW8_CIMLE|nr:glutamate receptor ionotropic, kainate 2-like [Cimex lectularius]